MMQRRTLLLGSVGLLAASFAAEAQDAGKTPRVGFLAFGPHPLETLFNNALHQLGWEDGRNLVIERRYTQSPDMLSRLAAELVQLAPQVIVASNAGLASIVRRETTSIPIVVIAAGDLIAPGLAESLARPGRHVTGMQIVDPERIGKRLQLLTEIVTKLTRVAALSDLATVSAKTPVREWFEAPARELKIQLLLYEPHDVGDLEDQFKAMIRQQVQAVTVGGTPFTFANARLLTELAARYRIPAVYTAKEFAVVGGLLSYGVDFADVFARGAIYVDKILRGTNPADIPVEQPTKFDLMINLPTARALGLEIPPTLLARADEIIE